MDEDVHVARLDVVPSPVALPTPTPVTATAIASTLLVEGSGAQRSIHPIHRSLQVASAHPRGNSAANSRAGTPVQPPPDGVLSEDVLRKCILAIQRDATLNAREKAQRTQVRPPPRPRRANDRRLMDVVVCMCVCLCVPHVEFNVVAVQRESLGSLLQRKTKYRVARHVRQGFKSVGARAGLAQHDQRLGAAQPVRSALRYRVQR